jgi:hypothetical protein
MEMKGKNQWARPKKYSKDYSQKGVTVNLARAMRVNIHHIKKTYMHRPPTSKKIL